MLFSQDKDLLREAARRQRTGEPFSGVIYARQRTVSFRECLEGLELLGLAGEPNEFANGVVHLPY